MWYVFQGLHGPHLAIISVFLKIVIFGDILLLDFADPRLQTCITLNLRHVECERQPNLL